MPNYSAHARAHSNIALVKYWGKRNAELNLPTAGSISITLDALYTDTNVQFCANLEADELWLNGHRTDTKRITPVLDLIRRQAKLDWFARITSTNNFPTSAGLASSASGFCALVEAAAAAAGLKLSRQQLSVLARQGSGSAARSVFGGYVQMHAGEQKDGHDAHASPLLAAKDWPLAVVIAITDASPKAIDSRAGMGQTTAASPFYESWVQATQQDLLTARKAIMAKDFQRLGQLSENNCLRMHSVMLSTQPALIYWAPATLAIIHKVRQLRSQGWAAYFTIDAGPQVKVLCPPDHAQALADQLADLPGVVQTLISSLGPASYSKSP